ncbi:MAG TPA: hypothetical protein VFS16_11025, partial [Acidimicrobiia bacterium]|nr:hypothetical protein [Acidimicrobiia bacterium]
PSPVTSKSLIDGMYSLRNETLGGLLPGITYNQGEHVAVNLCIVRLVVENRKFVALPKEDQFTCAPGYVPGDPDASRRAIE